jgi:hypothetical protein
LELNNYRTYLAIGIIGVVVGILYLILQDDLSIALVFFFATLYLIVMLRYLLERRHYKKHKAALASTQFLLLPFSILLMGNYISPFANFVEIFILNVDISGGESIQVYFNLVSLSLIVPIVILSLHFSNYYSRKWPAMAVNRKVRRGRAIPTLLHTAFILILLAGFFINWKIDFLGFLFIILYIIYFIRYFIVDTFDKTRREVVTRPTASTSSTTTTRTPTTTQQRTSSQRQTRTSTTATRSRSSRASSASVRIDPGRSISTTRKPTVKVSSTKVTDQSIFPAGRPTREDLKCIICYMDFKKSDPRRVVLCPHCKYPAHEDEFLNWFKRSKRCARCNKPISTRYVKKPAYRVVTKIYIERVIEKL